MTLREHWNWCGPRCHGPVWPRPVPSSAPCGREQKTSHHERETNMDITHLDVTYTCRSCGSEHMEGFNEVEDVDLEIECDCESSEDD